MMQKTNTQSAKHNSPLRGEWFTTCVESLARTLSDVLSVRSSSWLLSWVQGHAQKPKLPSEAELFVNGNDPSATQT